MRALIAGFITIAGITVASAQEVGVPVCDKLLKSYETCVMTKAAPQTQTQMKSVFDQMRQNWVAVAATAEGKKSLEPVCEQTTTQLKTQLASLNCAW